MSVQQYVVVGHCANLSVQFPDGRKGRQLFFKGQPVPTTATEAEIAHHLSIKAIAPVGGQSATEPAVQQVATTEPAAPSPEESSTVGDPSDAADGEASSEGEQGQQPDTGAADADGKWAEADTKAEALVSAGAKPDGRSNPLVMAAFLVRKGYDRAAVEKADKPDLLALVNSLDQ